ncbi:MAG: DegT/DnrJ/EryC1/StrS family aminotransferase [Acidobacteriota bacterium]|nr:DegT/DnrJ/EryC1/StrS family aminotransferase [Acidobacteriota bacterium]
MTVPRWPEAGERELELLREVLADGRWGAFHPIVDQFERKFAAFQHSALGVSACNGTVTLEMILEALGIGPGDEVIVPAISFISTATAVSRSGATPVFVDIEETTFNIDPARAAEAITLKTKAVIAVHFGGPMADMDRLGRLGIPLIEDAAHAHGSEWSGRRAGSWGRAGSFSFQNSKVMTAGEGGIVTTNDGDLAGRIRAIGNQGRRADRGWFEHYTLGTNYRMTALQAAILLAQLGRLPEQNGRRARNAAILRSEVPEIRWRHVPEEAGVNTNYLSLGRVKHRDAFHRAVTAAGIPCTPFYPHTLYNNPLYRAGGCRVMPCPVAEMSIGDAFWLPHRVLLGSEENTRELARVIREAAVHSDATLGIS